MTFSGRFLSWDDESWGKLGHSALLDGSGSTALQSYRSESGSVDLCVSEPFTLYIAIGQGHTSYIYIIHYDIHWPIRNVCPHPEVCWRYSCPIGCAAYRLLNDLPTDAHEVLTNNVQ